MRALWIEGQNDIQPIESDTPMRGPGEALIRVNKVGICGTDLALVRGMHRFRGVPGHEFVGTVVEDDATPSLVNRRVVADINLHCGHCRACALGRPKLCQNRRAIGIDGHAGAFADYIVITVPDHLPDASAVFAEPLAAALQIQSQVPLAPPARVLVVGAGRLGQLIVRTVALTGCEVAAVVKHPTHAELARPFCDVLFSPTEVPDAWADVVIEVTGHSAGLGIATRAVVGGGTVVLKSTFDGTVPLDITDLVLREINVVGSRCGPIDAAIRLMAKGAIDVEPLIQAMLPWARALDGFDIAARSGAMKVIVDLDSIA
jgi:threonine dehydrogenase-like Zn-dependent dehydrogenase